MKDRLLRLVLYALAVLAPILVVFLIGAWGGDDPLALQFGDAFAFIGIGILVMQPVLAARICWIERPFGLDRIFRFHKLMAIVAGSLIVCHPFLVAAGKNFWPLITSFSMSWPVQLGRIGIIVLLCIVLTALFYRALRLSFESWRRLHDVLAVALLGIAGIHSGFVGGLFEEQPPVLVLWIVLGCIVLAVFSWHRIVRPLRLRRRAWKVADVKQEAHNVWTLTLEPPAGEPVIAHVPGQFHFLTLLRRSGPVEEHPFTIASSPASGGSVTSTIKASGDFTATVKDTQAGEIAVRQGPFGRFSCALYPEERDLVFIAGGIGITPLMSMLRWMRGTGADRTVLLLYGNRTEGDIVFREELDEIERGGKPALRIAHVLSAGGDSWKGERGNVDEERIVRFCGRELKGKAFYVCGPPVMMAKVISTLRTLGVPRNRIHSERFAL